jgi:hypothetical protein
MNVRTPRRDGEGPSLVGAIVFAVFVAVNVAAGPNALEGSVQRAAAASRSAVATVVRHAADLALRFGVTAGGDDAPPPETCAAMTRHGHGARMQRRACEIRLRCDTHGSTSETAPAVPQAPVRPWFCPSPT